MERAAVKHLNGLASWTPGGPSAGMFFWFGDWPPHAPRPPARPTGAAASPPPPFPTAARRRR